MAGNFQNGATKKAGCKRTGKKTPVLFSEVERNKEEEEEYTD